jgi:hypothetical protein
MMYGTEQVWHATHLSGPLRWRRLAIHTAIY